MQLNHNHLQSESAELIKSFSESRGMELELDKHAMFYARHGKVQNYEENLQLREDIIIQNLGREDKLQIPQSSTAIRHIRYSCQKRSSEESGLYNKHSLTDYLLAQETREQ